MNQCLKAEPLKPMENYYKCYLCLHVCVTLFQLVSINIGHQDVSKILMKAHKT